MAALTVADSFTQATAGASQVQGPKRIWEKAAASEDGQQIILTALKDVCNRLVQADKDAVGWDRAVMHLREFGEQLPRTFDWPMETLEELLEWLADSTCAVEPLQRQRALSVMYWLLSGIQLAGKALSKELREYLADSTVLPRLQDKIAGVRRAAVRVLPYLFHLTDQDCLSPDDTVVPLLIKVSSEEQNKAVRVAAADALLQGLSHTNPRDSLCKDICQCLVARTLDIEEEVRAGVFKLLATPGLTCTAFTLSERLALLKHGLGDKATGVRGAAGGMFCSWLRACGGDVHELLQHLDVTGHTGLMAQLLDQLVCCQELDATRLLVDAVGGSLRDATVLMSPELAFTRRWACLALHSRIQELTTEAAGTAGATERDLLHRAAPLHAAMEQGLPESGQDMVAICEHTLRAGPTYRFCLMQLLMATATCMDWTEGPARAAGEQLLKKLLTLDPREEDGVSVMVGSGGSGEWERVVVQFGLAVASSPADLLTLVLAGVRYCMEDWQCEVMTPGAENAACWLQCVTVVHQVAAKTGQCASAVLAQGATSPEPHWVVGQLLLPALGHPAAAVRSAAAPVLALVSCLPAAHEGLLGQVCAATWRLLNTDPSPTVRGQALSVLCGMACARGVRDLAWDTWAHTVVEAQSVGTADDLADQMADTSLEVGRPQPDLVAHLQKILQQHLTMCQELAGGKSAPRKVDSAATSRRSTRASKSQPTEEPAAVVDADPALLMAAVQGAARLLHCQHDHERRSQHLRIAQTALKEDQVHGLLRLLLAMAAVPRDNEAIRKHHGAFHAVQAFLEDYRWSVLGRARLAAVLISTSRLASQIKCSTTQSAAVHVLSPKGLAGQLLLGPYEMQRQKQVQAGSVVGSGAAEWVPTLAVQAAVELERLMSEEEPPAGTDHNCIALAELLTDLRLDPHLHNVAIRACLHLVTQCQKLCSRKVLLTLTKALRTVQGQLQEFEAEADALGAALVTAEEVEQVTAAAVQALSVEAGSLQGQRSRSAPVRGASQRAVSSRRRAAVPVSDSDDEAEEEVPATDTTESEDQDSD